MKFRSLVAALVGIAAAGSLATPAEAVRYGTPDNGEHPYVGLMLAYQWQDSNKDGLQSDDELKVGWRCTGTQIDADTYLTAGHCTEDADAVAIWYGENLENVRLERQFRTLADAKSASNPHAADAYSYQALVHPSYDPDAFYTHDAGIVELAEPVDLPEYGTLPEQDYWAGQLATNKPLRDWYTTVGYGLQRSLPDKGKAGNLTQALWLKEQAHGELVGYRQFGGGKDNTSYVILTSNANTGGTCSGDSGGPTFIGDSNVIVGLTSFGMNETCSGTSGIYRIDQADDLAWIKTFL